MDHSQGAPSTMPGRSEPPPPDTSNTQETDFMMSAAAGRAVALQRHWRAWWAEARLIFKSAGGSYSLREYFHQGITRY
ncbi:hypothetical protein E2C01_018437 [Portunus trituberculatus]|uniref:Uncharacterized protein n=1 Tax=Portunus trituberculatus TaxID=210409 RepID=A0A5B7DUG5_PORTR|nr:hypothetical protein [Portunus trituberculatus]